MLEFDEKLQNEIAFFQNFLDYETFVKLLEMHKKQPTWKMYLEKMKKKFNDLSWLTMMNNLSKHR